MKTVKKLSDTAQRYKDAETFVWNKMQKWQKAAIADDRKQNKDSSILTTFIKEVIAVAEFTGKSVLPRHTNVPKRTEPFIYKKS